MVSVSHDDGCYGTLTAAAGNFLSPASSLSPKGFRTGAILVQIVEGKILRVTKIWFVLFSQVVLLEYDGCFFQDFIFMDDYWVICEKWTLKNLYQYAV